MNSGADKNLELIDIGRVRRAVGLDGRVEVEVYSGDNTRFAPGVRVFVDGVPLTVKSSRSGGRGGSLVVVFEGIGDRNASETIRGATINAPFNELPPAAEGSYYHFEIIGCAVKTVTGNDLGVVTGVMETGSNDVFVVKNSEGKETLIPSIKAVIVRIDRDNRLITIDPPDGLIS